MATEIDHELIEATIRDLTETRDRLVEEAHTIDQRIDAIAIRITKWKDLLDSPEMNGEQGTPRARTKKVKIYGLFVPRWKRSRD